MRIVTIYIINMRLDFIIEYENNSGKNMPEYKLMDNPDKLPEVIYFTDSFFALHIIHINLIDYRPEMLLCPANISGCN